MRNVLLLHPEMLFYKIPIFNKLSDFLDKHDYKLIIWYSNIDDPNGECNFTYINNLPFTTMNYQKVLRSYKIEIVINTLLKMEPGISFYLASILKARALRIPVIYYGHGLNIQKKQWWRDILYNLTYFIFDGIILYSPTEKTSIWKMFHHKITCAYNTLDIGEIHIKESKEVIKSRYGINAPKILLSTGRFQPRKKIEILCDMFVENFSGSTEIAWILVGSELDDNVKNTIKDISNVHYLGPIYNKEKMGEIFSIADVYCIPGALGLGIVEALYWGLPVVTMAVNHGPEAYYLKDGLNSLIAHDRIELKEMVHELLFNDEKRTKLSICAKKVYNEEATLDKMFEGFISQLGRIE